MGWGMFGKLPAKRDFIALRMPRIVLEPYEAWLQGAVAASRDGLGRSFEDSYMVSPVWRFVIGDGIFGVAFTGALMPSVDRVNRMFPLTIGFAAEPGEAIAPPTVAEADAVFETLDQRLLSALDDANLDIEPERLLDDLPPVPVIGRADRGFPVKRGLAWHLAGGEDRAAELRALASEDYAHAAAFRSYWWTGDVTQNSGSLMFSVHGMPDPYLYANMLTGRFGAVERAPLSDGM